MTSTDTTTSELATLGAVMLSIDAANEVFGLLKCDDFFNYPHKLVYQAAFDLWSSSRPVNVVSVGALLLQRHQVADLGPDGLTMLVTMTETAGTGHVAAHFAQRVRDASILRRLKLECTSIVSAADLPNESADAVLQDAERRIAAIAERTATSDVATSAELVADCFDRLDARMQGRRGCVGLPSGFADIDRLGCGFQNGELTTIGARPGVGKTSWLLNVVRNVLKASRVPVLFVSLEQSKREVIDRLASMESGICGQQIRNGWLNADDVQRFHQAGDAIREWPLYVDDVAGQSMLRVTATARRMKRQHGIALVVLDYLQLLAPEDRRSKRYEQIGEMTRRLKMLARDLDVPVIVASQLNREVEGRGDQKPRLSDLRESGNIEQDSDVVMLLHRNVEGNVTEVNIAKQRNGPTGSVQLVFRDNLTRFENYAAGANEL